MMFILGSLKIASWSRTLVDFLLVLIELFSLGAMAEALRAKIHRKSAISLQRGQFDPEFQPFQVEGVAPLPMIFARIYIVRPMNALYNFVTDSFHTTKLCSRLPSSVFEPLVGLRGNVR